MSSGIFNGRDMGKYTKGQKASIDRANAHEQPIEGTELPWDSFLTEAESQDYASDLTHPLYPYPARISPQLARALIAGLTRPGDLVLDPFSGGGTTAIEALSNGRAAICADLNSLACFVTRAKAWPVGTRSLRAYRTWAASAVSAIPSAPPSRVPLLVRDGTRYAPRTHALLLHLKSTARAVKDRGARRLAFLTVLRVGQLCFDCRSVPPTPWKLVEKLRQVAKLIADRMASYAEACRRYEWPGGLRRNFRVIQCDAEKLVSHLVSSQIQPVSLILTSPPYPGVHVLYHRWQLYGRKETALPYHLLDLNDGAFESYYTFGSRQRADVVYFEKLTKVFASLRRLATSSTIVAQVVGFANPARHLRQFREAMEAAGFEEIANPDLPENVIRRIIPHRRWYAELQGDRHEVLLLHRLREDGSSWGIVTGFGSSVSMKEGGQAQ